jgi:hypothetical protein
MEGKVAHTKRREDLDKAWTDSNSGTQNCAKSNLFLNLFAFSYFFDLKKINKIKMTGTRKKSPQSRSMGFYCSFKAYSTCTDPMEGEVISSVYMNPNWYTSQEDSRWLPVNPGAPLVCIPAFPSQGGSKAKQSSQIHDWAVIPIPT